MAFASTIASQLCCLLQRLLMAASKTKQQSEEYPSTKLKQSCRTTYGPWIEVKVKREVCQTPHLVSYHQYNKHFADLHSSTAILRSVAQLTPQLRVFICDISNLSNRFTQYEVLKPPKVFAIHLTKRIEFTQAFNEAGLSKFVLDFLRSTHFMSEPYPEEKNIYNKTTKHGPPTEWDVKRVVALNFHELVAENRKDVVFFLYRPMCEVSKTAMVHLRKLAKVLYDSGEHNHVDVVEFNLEANSLPINLDSRYSPPLLALVKCDEKSVIVKVWGQNLGVSDMIKFLAQNSTQSLKGYDRNGELKNSKQKHKKEDNKYFNNYPSYTTSIEKSFKVTNYCTAYLSNYSCKGEAKYTKCKDGSEGNIPNCSGPTNLLELYDEKYGIGED